MSPPTSQPAAATSGAPAGGMQAAVSCRWRRDRQKIAPTYVSSDLIIPGQPRRETLPAIGYHQPGNESRMWGQETLPGARELAYHGFKNSYTFTRPLIAVTHRHFGNRVNKYESKEQPHSLTSLLYSKCRLNDQMLPAPMIQSGGKVVDNKIINRSPSVTRGFLPQRRTKQLFPTSPERRPDALIGGQQRVIPPLGANAQAQLKRLKKEIYHTSTNQLQFQACRALGGCKCTHKPVKRIQSPPVTIPLSTHGKTEPPAAEAKIAGDDHDNKKAASGGGGGKAAKSKPTNDNTGKKDGAALAKNTRKTTSETGKHPSLTYAKNLLKSRSTGDYVTGTGQSNQLERHAIGVLERQKRDNNGAPIQHVENKNSLSLQAPHLRPAVWPEWPLGQSNVSYHPPSYPFVILPKYILQPLYQAQADTGGQAPKQPRCICYACGCPNDGCERCFPSSDAADAAAIAGESPEDGQEASSDNTAEAGSSGNTRKDIGKQTCETPITPKGSSAHSAIADSISRGSRTNARLKSARLRSAKSRKKVSFKKRPASSAARKRSCEARSADKKASLSGGDNKKSGNNAAATAAADNNNNGKSGGAFDAGFKTEAHQRYHSACADALPDLRENRHQGKKHQFVGINSQVLRGSVYIPRHLFEQL